LGKLNFGKKAILKIIKLYGLVWLITAWIGIFYIFIQAYFSQNKTVIVDINEYGEANVELILLLTSVPCFIALSVWCCFSLEKERAIPESLKKRIKR
jgi:hypothetical protein